MVTSPPSTLVSVSTSSSSDTATPSARSWANHWSWASSSGEHAIDVVNQSPWLRRTPSSNV
jgi:hypothetical protein